MVDLNNKLQRNVNEEISNLNEISGGDWVNVTSLYSKIL